MGDAEICRDSMPDLILLSVRAPFIYEDAIMLSEYEHRSIFHEVRELD